MAGPVKSWRTLRLLILLSLLSLTQHFEVRDDEWEELRPDIAALHRLRGLSEHMFHERLNDPWNQRDTVHGARVDRSGSKDQNPMSLLEDLWDDKNFTASVIQREEKFDSFLAAIDKQKTIDRLISASETSRRYSQKFLVMTDAENSTNDRVQQEYSIDPHNSRIVSKECLYSVSCVPVADNHTLVKIFGSVSEDGQTVSSLSGTSLAELMLKPSLKNAPVFSLEGNTTKHFQSNFLRVFMVRGIEAVLETNQGNRQNYQATNEHGSDSQYETQRQDHHTTQYDRQHILIMEDDPVVKNVAGYLYEKHPAVTSVYVVDQNRRPKLIHGALEPLTDESTLVLVGHGRRLSSGEMTLADYSVQDVAEIIKRTFRVSDKIKTTRVVAGEVRSDRAFIENLLRELREKAKIETEVHISDAVLQESHTGERITQEIFRDGLRRRGKDDNQQEVVKFDREENVIRGKEPGSQGEPSFANGRNLLPEKGRSYFLVYKDSWPEGPKRFIDQNVYDNFDNAEQVRHACDELEALSWAFFHAQLPRPEKINTENLNLEEYYLTERIKTKEKNKWKVKIKTPETRQKIENILSKCYVIKSGKDVRNIIRHYAKDGENEDTHLMVNDWIFEIDCKSLFVYPVGKKLGNNQIGDRQKINEVKNCITQQLHNEKYTDMRPQILQNTNINNPKERYAQYVKNIFLGQHTTDLPLSAEAWYTTYFTASVIAESARNFRTFPLILMALDMAESPESRIKEKGLNFLFEEHSMARGRSWIDPSRRGFSGSATPEGSSKLQNQRKPETPESLMESLKVVITKEVEQYQSWIQNGQDIWPRILKTADDHVITERNSFEETNNYRTFKIELQHSSRPPPPGALGGYNDGHVTSQDPLLASEVENSFKLESYFSRIRVLSAEQIYNQLKAKYGENLAELRLQGSARMEDGQFICNVFKGADIKPDEFRATFSQETQRYNEILSENIDTAVTEMETHSSRPPHPHPVNKYVEHSGTAVGMLSLMMGMKGAVRAYEQGDIKDTVVGSLQTAHGMAAMTTSVIAQQTLSSQQRIARAATAIMKSPAMKGTMTVIPVVGMGFGVYNFQQDLKRGDTLGYIDAVLDGGMIPLDALAIVQPEVAPFILALSAVRMVIDDVYMGIQNELHNIPADAGALQKLRAVASGFVKGTWHFAIHVASFFYNWRYDEIQEGHRFVEQISNYDKYYRVTKQRDGMNAIDFSGGASSWNGGGIDFHLADQGQSDLCMEYFVSSDETFRKKCWKIDTHGSKDIILGLGESHQLEYKKLQKKILMFIPAGSVKVVSGYKTLSNSRYGIYKGNRYSNRFFAIQKAEDKHAIEVMLNYYYKLYGEPGDDIFYLGPQRSYVEGSGGKDTYIIPKNGGKTIINNYDPSKALDTLHFSVDYSHISVSKSGDDVVLMYEVSHSVTIQGWFSGELYRHMTMMSGDGVLFEISSAVISSVKLVARGINKMFNTHRETVDASQPLLRTVTHIFGSRYNDLIYGNRENNLIDGGGGHDFLIGGEGEDMYIVKDRNQPSAWINNYSIDTKIDLAIIETNLDTFNIVVEGNNVVLNSIHGNTAIRVGVVNWFKSPAYRHLLFVTKDLITFTISDNKNDCLLSDPFIRCIKSRSIDYSNSKVPLLVDLEKNEAFDSVTEVRGSSFDDEIRGNKLHNVVVPGKGKDFIQGRGGEDWYVITPGHGEKTINNESPDVALDILFLKELYQHITCTCEGKSIIIWVHGRKEVILENWFDSKNYQHLQIKTSDGTTAGLTPNHSSCGESIMFPITVDYRNQKPEPLHSHQTPLQKRSVSEEDVSISSGRDGCVRYKRRHSKDKVFCNRQGKVMMMDNAHSVKEMYGSPGFDIMVGNSNENLLDPFTGGALMFGGEGKDAYIIKHGYGNNLMIDNFAKDQNIDTVWVDMDYLDGSRVALKSSSADLNVTITTKGEQLKFSLVNYNNGYQHQHLEFQTADGVNFKLKSLNSAGGNKEPSFQIEAFKVTLKQSQVDCRLELKPQRNLSKVHTVQGCPSQSNDILGNDQDNVLIGGWKDDALEGGEGDDTLIGGNGADILIGDLGDDTLYGEAGNDTMMGNSGWDVFIPGPGADLMDGGPGRDTVLYRGDHETGKGVYVNLLIGQGRYADAEGDVLKDVETVIGTIYSDILVSGYESSLLKGSDGNDLLVSTGGDYLVGGAGNDIYMLAFHDGSVTIDNCAKDNAIDVLYLSSQLTPATACQHFTDRVLLTFYGLKQNTVKIALKGWTSDRYKCGHLTLFYKNAVVSVDELLQNCHLI